MCVCLCVYDTSALKELSKLKEVCVCMCLYVCVRTRVACRCLVLFGSRMLIRLHVHVSYIYMRALHAYIVLGMLIALCAWIHLYVCIYLHAN